MRSQRAALVWGILFIALGAGFLGERLGLFRMSGRIIFPALLIGFGIALLVGHDDDRRRRRVPFTHEHRPDDPPKNLAD